MTRHDIFSTPFWNIEGIPQQLVDELYKGAYRYKERYEGTSRSNDGGYQSPLFSWNYFHPQGIKVINNILDNNIEYDYEIQAWWYNINGKGDWNLPHTHPNSDLALVLYLTDTDNLLTLINRVGGSLYSPNTNKGDILLFPADLLHFVKPNKRDTDRISISMNLRLC